MTPDLSGVRLYIFDADGTLRWTTVAGQKYPLAAHEWRLMPGVTQKLAAIPWAEDGPWLAIASNQNGVARGELGENTARQLMHDMLFEALGHVPPRTRIEMCICDESLDCTCRKPEPGLLLRLIAHFGVRPEETLFVGDLAIDQEAARRANVRFVWAHEFFGAADS
jgi:D-glycero-D-manno-heptose 1,7-bisphosphate phosphatase